MDRCFREEDEVMITLLRGVSNYTSEYPCSTISINSPSTSSTVNIETEEESDMNVYSPRRLRNQGHGTDDSGNRTRSARDSLRESVERPRCGMKHSNSCRISDRRPMEAEPIAKPIEDDESDVPRSEINLYDKFNMRRSNNAKDYEQTDNRQTHAPHNVSISIDLFEIIIIKNKCACRKTRRRTRISFRPAARSGSTARRSASLRAKVQRTAALGRGVASITCAKRITRASTFSTVTSARGPGCRSPFSSTMPSRRST